MYESVLTFSICKNISETFFPLLVELVTVRTTLGETKFYNFLYLMFWLWVSKRNSKYVYKFKLYVYIRGSIVTSNFRVQNLHGREKTILLNLLTFPKHTSAEYSHCSSVSWMTNSSASLPDVKALKQDNGLYIDGTHRNIALSVRTKMIN